MAGFKLFGKWKRFSALVDASKFTKAVEAAMTKATQFNGHYVAKMIRANIQASAFRVNVGLTIAIKHSSKSLIDEGLMFQAVGFKEVDFKTVFVGVLRQSISLGTTAADIAEIVHEGTTIPVTPAMRGLFYVLADALSGKRDPSTLTGRALELYERLSKVAKRIPRKTVQTRKVKTNMVRGKKVEKKKTTKKPKIKKDKFVFKPLKPSTSAIVIHPRPFMRQVFEDPAVLKKVRMTWEKAYQKGISQKGS